MLTTIKKLFLWHMNKREQVMEKIYVVGKSFQSAHNRYLAAKCARGFVARKIKKVD
jgi:hypothetical protein